MRHFMSFKEFLRITEADALPQDQKAAATRIKMTIATAAGKSNPGDPQAVMDKAVLKQASAAGTKNPVAVAALADAAKRKKP